MSIQIDRKTFLKGLGTTIALPALDAMLPQSVLAETPKKRTNRMVFISIPNGVHLEDWTPKATGDKFELPYILEPLKPFQRELSVFTGLTQDKARPNGDGPGDHARSAAAWLTGCQPKKTSGADIKVGISADQLAAQQIGGQTRFGSLELGCERGAQAGNCDSGYSCAYSSTIAWRSENTPVAKEVDPRFVFERLFGNGDASESAEVRHRRDMYKQSILDFVAEDAKTLQSKLGVHDQRKLDEYLTSVREIEVRLARAERLEKGLVGSEMRPTGVPADYAEHIRLMYDMLVLAFQSDLTRIGTFMYANEGSNRPFKHIGISEGHHDLSHHGRNEDKQKKLRQINRFQIEQLAYFLGKMKSIKEGDSNLLDNSMIVYGSGISDGDRHNHDDLPILFAGKGAGTVKTGVHTVYPKNTPMANLFLCMFDRMGVRAEKIGDSTGRLEIVKA